MKKFGIFFLIFFLSWHAHAEEKKIETIISNGIGISIQDAAQNAAENALTQAVGSFIDATTLVEKRTEIADGVISRSKVINKDIKEYSQGSIKYFEILEANQTNGIYKVAARVDVRIEDFRAYIKELATGTQVIKDGLFAQMKTTQDNIEDRMSLIVNKIYSPIMRGEVHNIEIQSPMPYSEFKKFCDSHFSSNNRCNIRHDWNPSEVIAFQFSISLKDEFVENMINIFENISNSKQTLTLDENSDVANYFHNHGSRDSFYIINPNNNFSANLYTIDNYTTDIKFYIKNNLSEQYRNISGYVPDDISDESRNSSSKTKCFFSANLNFVILNQDEKPIFNKVTPTCYDINPVSSYGGYCTIDPIPIAGYGAPLSLFNNFSNRKFILPKRNYFLLIKPSPDVFQNAKSVKMFFTN